MNVSKNTGAMSKRVPLAKFEEITASERINTAIY